MILKIFLVKIFKIKKAIPRYMFLAHVNNIGKFLKFLSKNIFFTLLKRRGKILFLPPRFIKNTVPLLKPYNFYILNLISFQVMTKSFHKKLHRYQITRMAPFSNDVTSNLAENFYIRVYAPRQHKIFRCPANVWKKIYWKWGGGGIKRMEWEIRYGHEKVDNVFANFWLVNSEATLDCTLNNMPVSHQHFRS